MPAWGRDPSDPHLVGRGRRRHPGGHQAALEDAGYAVVTAEDCFTAGKMAEGFRPDLAVVDVRLGSDTDGFALAGHLRWRSDLPIVFLTAADDPEDRLAGFAVGADDYITKPFLMDELLARVRAVLRRSGRTKSEVIQIGDLVYDEGAHTVAWAGEVIELTATEFAVLGALVRHRGRVLSKLQLLSQVWGYDGFDPNIVEVHVSALRRKLGRSAGKLIQTVRGVGYVLRR